MEQGHKSLGRAGAAHIPAHTVGVSKVLPAGHTRRIALRLFFYFRFPHVTGDSLIYGDIAKNWLDHGIFGLSHADGPSPTWIRLPGYPAFLAACFVLFGREHYHAVLLAQIVVTWQGGSLSLTWRAGPFLPPQQAQNRCLLGPRPRGALRLPARGTLPVYSHYTAAPLAETLSIFFTAVALDCAVAAFMASDAGRSHRLPGWGGVARFSPPSCCVRTVAFCGGHWTVPAMANVAAAGAASASVLRRSSGAGDRRRSPGAVDCTQLARLSPLPAAGATLRQRP